MTERRPPTPIGDDTAVSASTIAEMAGVRPSAVSNWRRRHADFPPAIATAADGGDLFSLRAIERWLGQREIEATPPDASRLLWHAMVDSTPGESIDIGILEALTMLDHADGKARSPHPSPPVPTDHRQRIAAAEQLMERRQRALRRGSDHESHPDLVRLLVGLAAPLSGTVANITAGLGGLMIAAAAASTPSSRLVGEEIDPTACAIARRRLSIHGVDAQIHQVDTLTGSTLEGGAADVVYCDTPLGQRLDPDRGNAPSDPRWVAGAPGRMGDLAWLQHAAWLATPEGGRAYVVTTMGVAHGRGRAATVRGELLRRGMVEAVIALPEGSAGRTTRIPVVVWVLRSTLGSPHPARDVLLVDASSRPPTAPEAAIRPSRRPGHSFDPDAIVAIVGAFRRGADRANLPTTPAAAATIQPVLELLRPGASLNPTAWRTPARPANLDQRIADLEIRLSRATDRLSAARPAPTALQQLDEPSRHSRLGELIDAGRVVVIRPEPPPNRHPRGGSDAAAGRPTRPSPPRGTPNLRPPSARDHEAPLTEVGDIIIAPPPTLPAARVEPHGGRPLPPRGVAVRIVDQAISPHLVAAAIDTTLRTAPRSSRPAPSMRLDEVMVPLPEERTRREWDRALAALGEQAEALAELLTTHRLLADALRMAAASGDLAPTHDPAIAAD